MTKQNDTTFFFLQVINSKSLSNKFYCEVFQSKTINYSSLMPHYLLNPSTWNSVMLEYSRNFHSEKIKNDIKRKLVSPSRSVFINCLRALKFLD